MKQVTVEWLHEKRACSNQVELFEETFGQSARITKANLLKAASVGLDLDWLAYRILTDDARRAYYEATASARKAYHEAIALARKAYDDEATALARKAHYEATARAWKAYYEAIALARKAYYEAVAPALWEALIK